jgi:hypothetical protein
LTFWKNNCARILFVNLRQFELCDELYCFHDKEERIQAEPKNTELSVKLQLFENGHSFGNCNFNTAAALRACSSEKHPPSSSHSLTAKNFAHF